ncbi:hypothetical protein Sps_04013 [Shewanella psychrophila]|uniref:Uncharacterized protein n=1 Tax=Shewanella psychrophila TaxID=225848 RepID=A0A1S6HUF2_9GAMM|nr:hypothetical protein [Shewanella psychrophila]AQS39121.1 hypothetical protein Sps_04006 [Shewanella psychrophila]AQS39128.1 hypothetical protein Sps_04013 [Shewanella psychrophila]
MILGRRPILIGYKAANIPEGAIKSLRGKGYSLIEQEFIAA